MARPAETTRPGQDRSGGDQRLPATRRVRSARDFRRIYARGQRAGGKHLMLVALRRRQPGHRVGLSVSKAHGCAVVRNKIKRIFKEAFRLQRAQLPGDFDLVMIPRERPGKYQLPFIRRELQALVERIHQGRGRSRRRPQGGAGKGRRR